MKKHNKNLFYAEANQRQRFSIRKLTIGAASVLLSTAFYLGTNANVSHAETQTTSPATTTSEQNGGVPAPAADQSATKANDQKATNELKVQANNQDSKTSLLDQKSKNTDQSSELHFIDKNGNYIDTPSIKTDDQVSLQFKSNDISSEDKYKIVIHPHDPQEFNISKSYDVKVDQKSQQNSNITTSIKDNNNSYEIEDSFSAKPTSFNQLISIHTSYVFNQKLPQKDGNYQIDVDLYKNDQLLTTRSYMQLVKHNDSLHWGDLYSNPNNDSIHSLYTLDNNQIINENGSKNAFILPNQDYDWKLSFLYNRAFNQETTLTIPLPEHFVLNESEFQARNSDLFNIYHATLNNQNGNITITIPPISASQLEKLHADASTDKDTNDTQINVNLIGKINYTPNETTELKGKEIQINSNYGNNSYSNATISPLEVKVLGINDQNQLTPIGGSFNGSISPDNEDSSDKGFTVKGKQIHTLNKVQLKNQSFNKFQKASVTVVIPDGMNVSFFNTQRDKNDKSQDNFKYHYIYTDGSTSEEFSKIGNTNSVEKAPTGKYIKKIVMNFDNVLPYQQLFNIELEGKLADTYRGDNDNSASRKLQDGTTHYLNKGEKVNNLDVLDTKITLNANKDGKDIPGTWTKTQKVIDQPSDIPTDNQNHFTVINSELVYDAGAKNSGYLIIKADQIIDKYPNLTYYIVLPNNASINQSLSRADYNKNVEFSYLKINDRNVVKIHFNNVNAQEIKNKEINLIFSNSNIITRKNANSDLKVFVSLPENEITKTSINNYDQNNKVISYDLPFVENNKNSLYLLNTSWTVTKTQATSPTTQAKGNSDSSESDLGTSSDYGSNKMNFSAYITNNYDTDLTNVVDIIRMPNTQDGKSKFNYQITEAPKVFDETTHTQITDGVQIFYTTNGDYESKKMSEISTDNWQNDFSEETPVDFSNVTAIAVKINSIPGAAIYRVETTGVDPTLTTDAGKTAYVANKLWADNLNPTDIETGQKKSNDDSPVSAAIHVYSEINANIKVDRTINYVSAIDGKTISSSDSSDLPNEKIDVKYDNDKYKISTLPTDYKFDEVSNKQIDGYLPSTKKTPGMSSDILDQIINSNAKQLFGNHALTSGLKANIEYDKQNNKYVLTGISEDKNSPKNTITLNLIQNAYYAPSNANLIIFTPNKGNKIHISKSVNKDKISNNINFGITDDQLKIDGYKYTVYYLPSQFKNDYINVHQPHDYDLVDYKSISSDKLINENTEKFDTLAEALTKEGTFDKISDNSYRSVSNLKNDGSAKFAGFNSQNFLVVYTPISQRKQDLYIISDNDPYQEDPSFKPYAIPKSVEDSKNWYNLAKAELEKKLQEATTDDEKDEIKSTLENLKAGKYKPYFQISGQSNSSIISDNSNPNLFSTDTYYLPSDNADGSVGAIPDIGDDSNISSSYLYLRAGYYINKVTIQTQNGTSIVIDHNVTPNNLTDLSSTSNGDETLLKLLDYLTNSKSSQSDKIDLSAIGKDGKTSAYSISISGLNGVTTEYNNGVKTITIPIDNHVLFDNTKYDSGADPTPQIIKLDYALLPAINDKYKIQIHYVDVGNKKPYSQVPSFKEVDEGNAGFKFPDGTEYTYASFYPGDINWIEPDIISIEKNGDTYENTKDKEILDQLAKQGYYVVQRDKESTGKHKFDLYSTDKKTLEYNGNQPYLDPSVSPDEQIQNYYVYLKKGSIAKYHVQLEDKDGHITKDLDLPTDSDILGLGDPNTNIASGRNVLGTNDVAYQYAAIKDALAKKYQNYELVLSDNKNDKLKKSDELTDQKFGEKDADPVTLTLYMVPKYGNVTVHYVDVDGINKDPKDLTSTDGSEIHNQTPAEDVQYGKTYNNTVWDYGNDGYDLATTSLPDGAESGTVNSPSKDIYVFLKHKQSDLKTQPKEVNETIKFVDEKGKEVKGSVSRHITFTPEGYHDDKTGKDIITRWTPKGNFVKDGKNIQFDIEPTKVDGYDLDEETTNKDNNNPANTLNKDKKVAAITVDPNQELKDIHLTIYYKKQAAQTHIHYIDVNNSKKTSGFKSTDGTPIKGHDVDHVGYINDLIFPDDQTPWNYETDGWILAENPSNVNKDMKLTKDTPHDVYVYLKHKHGDLQTKPMTVNETVHYVDQDGKSIKSDSTAKMTLTPQGYHDNVTNTDVITEWKSDLLNSEFPTHSTKVSGYTIDMTKTKASDVSADHSQVKAVAVSVKDNKQPEDVEITIHYTKDAPTEVPGGNNNPNTPQPDPEKPTEPNDKNVPKTNEPSKNEVKKTPNNKKQPTKKSKKTKSTKTKTSKTTSPRSKKDNKKHWNENNRSLAQELNANKKHRHSTSNATLSENKVNSNATKKQNELPQTGEKQNDLGLLGLAFASIAGLFGIATDRKRKN